MEQPENRQMEEIRSINVPIGSVWKAWTSSAHIAKWWGPEGFHNTIHVMDLREGGEWKMTMHGPDGTNFPNRSVFQEIVPLERIVFEHFNPHFFTTVTFEDQGQQTLLRWTMLFDTVEMRDIIVKAHKADEGLRQNLDKLERYLAQAVV